VEIEIAGSPGGAHHGGATHSSDTAVDGEVLKFVWGLHINLSTTYRISHITVTSLNGSVVYRYYIYSCRLSTLFIPFIRYYYTSTLLFRPILYKPRPIVNPWLKAYIYSGYRTSPY